MPQSIEFIAMRAKIKLKKKNIKWNELFKQCSAVKRSNLTFKKNDWNKNKNHKNNAYNECMGCMFD